MWIQAAVRCDSSCATVDILNWGNPENNPSWLGQSVRLLMGRVLAFVLTSFDLLVTKVPLTANPGSNASGKGIFTFTFLFIFGLVVGLVPICICIFVFIFART